ncbi:peptidylprolyl isomerase [Porticoccaceae bacterium]|nr:peptidylprolyl isomerase [Porticoccaceae bacterium]
MTQTANNSNPIFRGIFAIAGLILVLVGSNTQIEHRNYPAHTLVLVNQKPITKATLTVARQRSTVLTNDTQQQDPLLIQRLIDDELILQRAESLGVLEADPGIRKLLARSTINKINTESQSLPISESQLRDFYDNHQAVFQTPARFAVQAARFLTAEEAMTARRQILAGSRLSETVSSADGAVLMKMPRSLLPTHMLRRYLGTGLTDVILQLDQDRLSQPIAQDGGLYLLHLLKQQPSQVIPFQQAQSDIIIEFRSRQRQSALLEALVLYKERADIRLNSSLLEQLARDE